MNKQQLAAKIWESANQMRSKIEANEYKDYILGFIFYKYLSDKEVQFAKKNDFTDEDLELLTEDDTETVDYFKNNLGYFIAYDNLFSTWIEDKQDFEISNVRDALSAFSRSVSPAHKKVFAGIFNTLETGLSKLGESEAARTKAARDLLQLIKNIPMNGKQDYDVLGFIYEYLIGMFAANAGKKAGEFYTPHEVSLLMSEITAYHLKDKKEIQIYDPTSGSGSLLVNIGRSVAKHIADENNIKYYAQELKQNTYNLTRMNLVMRGILPNNIVTRNGDTLETDWPYFDENDPALTYDPLYVDAVVSNPPYSQNWDSSDKESDPRYARFGLAPKSKADFAFLLHDLYHLKPDGIMTIVLPHGVLFRGGEEGTIRERLVEDNHIDAIIGLPPNIFFGTGIPTVIMVLRQKRKNTDTLIIDASKGFVKAGKNNQLRASDIKRITDTFISRATIPKYSKAVPKQDIRDNLYNLNIPRYVDSSAAAASWDMHAVMLGGIPQTEIDTLDNYWQAFPNLATALFAKKSDHHAELKVEEVRATIQHHPEVQTFVEQFRTAFGDFTDFLKTELLDNLLSVKIAQEEEVLSDAIFRQLHALPLIDRYEAYQLLDDEWVKIAGDLEIIQTEGMDATKRVDPNLVLKKKKGKEVEVQEGWKGRIMPFTLVQRTYLQTELQALQRLEDRLAAIGAEYVEILDSLTEEEKEAETINEAQTGFLTSEVNRAVRQIKVEIKQYGVFPTEAYETKMLRVGQLMTEEKALKKKIKAATAQLHLLTKKTIEELGGTQVRELLELKWIRPLVTALQQLPTTLIDDLTARVQTLADKYSTTYADVVEEIQATEQTLAALIGDLTGNDSDLEGLAALTSFLKKK